MSIAHLYYTEDSLISYNSNFKIFPPLRTKKDREALRKGLLDGTIDLVSSSTRRDDILLDDTTMQRMWVLRKFLADMNPVEAMESINQRVKQTKNNDEFLISMNG